MTSIRIPAESCQNPGCSRLVVLYCVTLCNSVWGSDRSQNPYDLTTT
jgi:hypothetical protein